MPNTIHTFHFIETGAENHTATNDARNPAAREEKTSPICGMPIIEADRCRMVIVMKPSMAAGFAGIENHLFYKDNTRILFGDAKASLNALMTQVKAG